MRKVLDVMVKRVITIDSDKTILDGAKLMTDKGVGCIIIVEKNSPIGIVTERDLVRKVMSKSIDPSNLKISDICSKPLITVNPNDPIEEVARKMLLYNIRRLPVVEASKLVGIITASDIAKSLVGTVSEADVILSAIARYHKYGY